MVQNNDEEWKKQHWWLGKQDKMLMVLGNEKKLSLTYHNMLGTDKTQNGIDTSITKQEAQNAVFFNKDTKLGSLQNEDYERSKKVNYSNCKLEEQKIFDQKHLHQQGTYQDYHIPSTPLL